LNRLVITWLLAGCVALGLAAELAAMIDVCHHLVRPPGRPQGVGGQTQTGIR
jgi:hypothetical protein